MNNICGQCDHFLAHEFTEDYATKPKSWVLDWCTDPYKTKHGYYDIYHVTPRSHCVNFEPLSSLGQLALTKLSQENNLPSGAV